MSKKGKVDGFIDLRWGVGRRLRGEGLDRVGMILKRYLREERYVVMCVVMGIGKIFRLLGICF